MAKEFRNPFEGTVISPETVLFDDAREQWQAGLMSSEDFLPMALKKLYGSHHLFQNGDTMLRNLSPNTIQKALQSSEVLNGARARGFNAEDPSPHMSELLTHYLHKFPGSVNLPRYKAQQKNPELAIKSWEFEAIDPKLIQSLPLHLYLGQKAGRPTGTGAESVYLSQYKNKVYDNLGDKKEATNILLWLHYKGLLSKIKRYEINSILRVADQKEFQYPYNNFEELATAVEPFAYFTGWRQRLEEANSEREFKLPEPFRNGMEKQSLLAANFLFEGSGYRQLDMVGKALKTIGQTASADKIREEFALMQAKAIVKGSPLPLRPWDVKNLKLEGLIHEHIKRLGGVVEVKIQPEEQPKIEEAKIPERKRRGRPRKALEPVKIGGSEDDVIDSGKKKKEKKVGKSKSEKEIEEKPILSEKELTEEREKRRAAFAQPRIYPLYKEMKTKDRLAERSLWTPTDFNEYLYLLRFGKSTHINYDKYPNELSIMPLLAGFLEHLPTVAPKEAKRRIVSYGEAGFETREISVEPSTVFGSEDVQVRRDRELAVQKIDPVIAEFYSEPYPLNPMDDKDIVSIAAVYEFLTNEKPSAIAAVSHGAKSYIMAQTNGTINIPEETHRITGREFQRKWFMESKLVVPDSLLGNIINMRGVSVTSSSLNRRPATILACKSHKVALYESDNHQEFKRIA